VIHACLQRSRRTLLRSVGARKPAVDERILAALRSATAGYRALESATRAQNPAAYAAARAGIDRAERDASTSLADLDALGYGRTVSPPRG
jgi:hypothetical protein